MDACELQKEEPIPRIDWQQVVLNGGPPCFHVDPAEPGKYCGRAERWQGHFSIHVGHLFVSLDDLLATVRRRRIAVVPERLKSMTTETQSTTEPPDSIWLPADTDADTWNILAKHPSRDWSTGEPANNIEYARVDRKYFCSCGGALTAEEYITHYFELGHDRGDPASPASAAPVVDEVIGVLEGIRGFYGTNDCWCDSEDDAPHFGHCTKARALYERLKGISPAAATAAPVDHAAIPLLGYERVITIEWDKHNARRHELIEAKRSRLLSDEEVSELHELQWLAGIKRELSTGPNPAAPVEQKTFKNTKEAMLYAQRNNIPAVVPVGGSSTSARAAAEEIETHLGVLPFSLIDEIHKRRQTIYRGIAYRVSPDIASRLKTDLDYLMAFVVALRHCFCTAESVGQETQ